MSVMSATSVLSLLLLLIASVRAEFLLLATFVTYNNSLDSYETTDNDTCCYTQRNCSERCNTILRYCFKEYGTVNNISDDENSAQNCIEHTFRVGTFSKPTEYIDYSVPHRDIVNNTITPFLTYRGVQWPGELQFFVRSAVGEEIVEYFELNFQINLGNPTLNATIDGSFFPSHMSFTVSLSLMCLSDFYGPNCSVFCYPANSSELGYYTCNSDGSRECLPGYGGSSCDEDIICGHTDTCNSTEMCSNTGDGSFTCTPFPTQPTPTTQTPTTPSAPETASALPEAIIGGVVVAVIVTVVVIVVVVLVMVIRKHRGTYPAGVQKRDAIPMATNEAYHTVSLTKAAAEDDYKQVDPDVIPTSSNEAYHTVSQTGGTTTDYEAVSEPHSSQLPTAGDYEPV